MSLVAGCASGRPAVRAVVAPSAPAPLLLWKITAPGRPGTAWLLGSVHLGRGGAARFDSAIDEALAAADETVLEIDLTPEVQAQVMERSFALGHLPADDQLARHVSAETYTALRSACERLELLPTTFDGLRPWLAATTLTLLQIKLAGYDDRAGVDRAVAHRTHEKQRPVRSLESVDQQLGLFAGADERTQELMLRDAIVHVNPAAGSTDALVDAYRAGDERRVDASVFEPLRLHPELAPLYERIFFARNRTMVEAIGKLLGEPKRFFVTVGAGHVVGERGIVEIMRKAGYRVERVEPKGGVVVAPVARSARPDTAASPSPSPAPSNDPWGEVRVDELGLRFELPRPPIVYRPTGTAVTTWISDETLATYVVMRLPPPSPALARSTDPMAFAPFARGLASSMRATVKEERAITFAGRPALRVIADAPTGPAVLILTVQRGELVLAMATRLGRAHEGDARDRRIARFFASVRLGDPSSPPH